MKQQTLAMAADQDSGFEHSRKPTRREEFLQTMDAIVPWAALCQVIEPHYPKAGNGRPPIGLERMLRIHFLQHWFNLADLACEEALYDSASLRRFVGIDLGRERVPDEKTGEAVKLVLVKKDPALTEAQVKEYCKANLTGYKQPKVIEFRTELPKTPVGKILRRELRDKK